jgi:hypothetical protein
LIVRVKAFEAAAPGLTAAIEAVPVVARSLAGIATVNCVGLRMVVVR